MPQRRPRRCACNLATPKARAQLSGVFSSSPQTLIVLVALRRDGLVHLRLQGMYGLAPAALEPDQISYALARQVLAVG